MKYFLTNEEENQLKLIEDPFTVDPEVVSIHLQVYIIEIRC